MVEIKSVSGRVLYVAKDAQDIRAALEAAVREGANLGRANLERANLGGAYLGGANLGGANLGRANLERANLEWANLGGANLEWANLGRANLGRANLEWANLGGANLGRANLEWANLGRANLERANLEWANLGGAYLRGAYLGRETWANVAIALKESLEAMNDEGRHWIKGSLTGMLEDGSATYCSVGSVQAHSDGTVRAVALWILESVCGGAVEPFNDFKDTSWDDIKLVFSVAIKHAERFAASA